MARFNMISRSSRSLCSVMLAVILASLLSLSPLARGDQNISYVLNGMTDSSQTKLIFVRCSFISSSYRTVEPYGTVLKPGDEKIIYIDSYPGVKQVECDITRYTNTTATINYRYNMKTVVWFFKGPSQTRFRFENNDMHFAVPPQLNNTNLGTGMLWGYDTELFFIPNFQTSSASIASSADRSKFII